MNGDNLYLLGRMFALNAQLIGMQAEDRDAERRGVCPPNAPNDYFYVQTQLDEIAREAGNRK